jgi:hypothetical protein
MRTRFVLNIVFLMLAASPLLGQGRCETGDTIATCWNRYLKPDIVVQEAGDQQEEELRRQPTGVDTGGANLATNTKNLLPLAALSGLLGAAPGEDEGTLVFDLNFLIPATGPQGARNAQLQAVVNTEPQISELLRNALPEEDRDDLAGQLGDGLGDLSDYSIRFTYNHANRSFGRSFALYAKRFGALSHAATSSVRLPGLNIQQLLEIIRDTAPNSGIDTDTKFQDMPAGVGGRVLLATEEKARDFAGFETLATRAIGTAGLARFHELLDNQPQFNVTAEKKLRDSLIGPDELSVKVTYEWSAMNFNNSMSEECHRALDSGQQTPTAADCLSQYTLFVTKNQDAIARGNRFSFTGEYTDIDEDTIDPGLDGVDPIALESVNRIILSAGWSRDFNLGGEPVAMDLVAEYQDISDDPLRRDRGVATLTFTRQFNNMSIPFGIVYANHGEFLPEVDEKLSAHIGLRFNLFNRDRNGDP